MKKIVRIVWISALTGLAFLSACLTQNGLTRRERKQLLKEREQVETQLAQCQKVGADLPVHQDYFVEYMDYFEEKYALENKLDAINYRLGDSIDLDRNMRRRQILKRIDSLNFLVETYDPPLVYGPPEMWDKDSGYVGEESDPTIWKRELKEAQTELDVFDRTKAQGQAQEAQLQEAEQRKLDSIQRRKELQFKRDSIRQARRGNSGGCVYGPPPMSQTALKRMEEFNKRCAQLQQELESLESTIKSRDSIGAFGSPKEMEEYRKETDSLKQEWANKKQELSRLKHERKARGL